MKTGYREREGGFQREKVDEVISERERERDMPYPHFSSVKKKVKH